MEYQRCSGAHLPSEIQTDDGDGTVRIQIGGVFLFCVWLASRNTYVRACCSVLLVDQTSSAQGAPNGECFDFPSRDQYSLERKVLNPHARLAEFDGRCRNQLRSRFPSTGPNATECTLPYDPTTHSHAAHLTAPSSQVSCTTLPIELRDDARAMVSEPRRLSLVKYKMETQRTRSRLFQH